MEGKVSETLPKPVWSEESAWRSERLSRLIASAFTHSAPMTRRHLFATAAATTAASVLRAESPKPMPVDPAFRTTNNRIHQSVMGWCFKPMDTLALAKQCKDMGLVAIEGIGKQDYKAVMDLGLAISLVGSHGFAKGPCDPRYQAEVIQSLTDAITLAADVGCKKVITFTGMKYEGLEPDTADKHCLDTWKKVLPLAEAKGITLCLEHLNSRDDTHPMKGHPGYYGDDVDHCFDLVRQMGSPHFKLLFDIYHVTIMNGDVTRRIRKDHELIGHYHTAGNPGRCEIDQNQEINYPPILRAILETGYEGHVAQEFIPTWSDPMLSLRHAAMVCDV
jgi:hydroxypyruvate isomerase